VNAEQKGLERGRKAGASAHNVPHTMEATFKAWRILYPTAADIDFAGAIRDLDRERLNDVPDLAHFPELRGHADLLRAERLGFVEASGLDETATAFFYSADFFNRRRLDTRHAARWEFMPAPGTGCTGVFFPETKEGGALLGQNIDIPLDVDSPYASHRPEQVLRLRDPVLWIAGGSSAVLLDDEPKCSFPADPFQYDLMPPECRGRIHDVIEFLGRYNEFWGPGNYILLDLEWNAVVVEKSNCLMAVRRPAINGAVATTACAYLDPKMSAHQLNRAKRVMELKGETEENSLDVNFHLGAGARYRRLLELVAAEAKVGATLWGAFEILSDHAVPYPDRICLTGEVMFPDKVKLANWTVQQHAAVISGPNRRCLYRSVQSFRNAKPIYHYTPKLMLGRGVKMKKQWGADVEARRCELAAPVTAPDFDVAPMRW